MDVEEGLRWIDSEFTGVVNPKDRHYRNELGMTESKKKKGAHDTVSGDHSPARSGLLVRRDRRAEIVVPISGY